VNRKDKGERLNLSEFVGNVETTTADDNDNVDDNNQTDVETNDQTKKKTEEQILNDKMHEQTLQRCQSLLKNEQELLILRLPAERLSYGLFLSKFYSF
jgi:hypothetical protein